mgnify:FL=1
MTRVARLLAVLTLALLAGCAAPPLPVPQPGPSAPAPAPGMGRAQAERAARTFVSVVDRVEPVAERECRARLQGGECDFQIFVDGRPGAPPNAFQTLDRRGRPVIVFTLALVADARNADEIAFILGHEGAHHIAGHIPRAQVSAELGALVLGGLAEAAGQGRREIDAAQQLGATLGFRTFAREFELEADALGTIIAARAGFDPLRGAEFFARIPDPGDRFLGTHPPNAQRMDIVRRTYAEMRRGGGAG